MGRIKQALDFTLATRVILLASGTAAFAILYTHCFVFIIRMPFILTDINECRNQRDQLCGDDKCIDTKGGYQCMKSRCPNQYFIKRSNS